MHLRENERYVRRRDVVANPEPDEEPRRQSCSHLILWVSRSVLIGFAIIGGSATAEGSDRFSLRRVRARSATLTECLLARGYQWPHLRATGRSPRASQNGASIKGRCAQDSDWWHPGLGCSHSGCDLHKTGTTAGCAKTKARKSLTGCNLRASALWRRRDRDSPSPAIFDSPVSRRMTLPVCESLRCQNTYGNSES